MHKDARGNRQNRIVYILGVLQKLGTRASRRHLEVKCVVVGISPAGPRLTAHVVVNDAHPMAPVAAFRTEAYALAHLLQNQTRKST